MTNWRNSAPYKVNGLRAEQQKGHPLSDLSGAVGDAKQAHPVWRMRLPGSEATRGRNHSRLHIVSPYCCRGIAGVLRTATQQKGRPLRDGPLVYPDGGSPVGLGFTRTN
jgi:hypothetical protein